MHDIKWIRDNPAEFDRRLMRRKSDFKGTAQRLVGLDEARRAAITVAETAQARRNAASKEIGGAKKAGRNDIADALMAEVNALKETQPKLEADATAADEALQKALAELPNLPLDEVPDGADEHGNIEHHKFGAKRDYKDSQGNDFTPKQHFELGEALGMMDFELAAKLSGARFVVLTGGLARLERALGQFMLDLHTQEHGYTEVNPPVLVRDDAMFGTAQLPKFKEDQFHASKVIDVDVWQLNTADVLSPDASMPAIQAALEGIQAALENRDAYWLIPTAEVPLTNLVREDITDEAKLPMRLTACTPCFRAEAGAAGRDTRGMIRQHQFTKVELVSITTPEQAMDEHERMTASAEEVLRRLGLHYRVVTLCTGDMGFASQKTYDIEVWLPGQNAFREISSCSVCGDFQARRMNARYKGKDGKAKGFVYTLNGSGVAVGRALIAVMETYQQADGSILVPDALKPYMGGMTVIEKKT
ncbi:serine--tRNA ligase [Pseudorhodoplanes sp.]|uniref:serine--tRNA ligase n=1 Tax=Pseudorhodoplanes sp. TaxID=1934341 RepID=UPI003D10D7D5